VYARVSRYRARAEAENVAERVRARVEQEFYPHFLVNAAGFRGYFIVDLDGREGRELLSFSLWDDRDSAERNVAHAEQYVRERLDDLLEETLQSGAGEVFLAR
jgi:heme-degrading monooxygenase HmoA